VVENEPVLHEVTYDPASAPKNDEGSVIISTIDITAANGVNDVTVRELSDGKVIDDYWPLKVYDGPRDDGEGSDETAGDGIYTVEYRTRSNAEEYDQVTIRIGVEDTTHTFTVADTVLPFGDSAYLITYYRDNDGDG
jgi:hypothetical protein